MVHVVWVYSIGVGGEEPLVTTREGRVFGFGYKHAGPGGRGAGGLSLFAYFIMQSLMVAGALLKISRVSPISFRVLASTPPPHIYDLRLSSL